MDITKYFKKLNDKLDCCVLNSFVPCSSTSLVSSVAREMNSVQEKQDRKKKRQVLPEKVKSDMAYYAWKHGNAEARIWASKKYLTLPRQGRPYKMNGELTTEVKSIVYNLRVSGGAVARKTVIPLDNGVLKARCPKMLEENGGSTTLTTKWARGVLKSLDWVKRRYTTAKTEMKPALYEELTYS